MGSDDTWYTAPVPTAFVRISAEMIEASHRGPLITPNERLARELSRALDLTHIEAGDQAWLPETVTSWRGLLRLIWKDHKEVLTTSGLKLVLRRTAPDALQGLIREAYEAWQLTHQYAVPCPAVESWFSRAADLVESMDCITEAQLEDALVGSVLPWAQLSFVGFEHFTPAQLALLERWQSDGCQYLHVPPSERLSPIRRLEFNSMEHELAAAAWWARSLLEKDPQATIGVLVPDLPRRHAAVVRQFAAILDPQNGASTQTFDIGAGPPLSQHPLWLDAQSLLRGLHTQVTAADVLRLGRSRHFDWQPTQTDLPWQLSWQEYLSRCPDPRLTQGLKDWLGGRPENAAQPLREWIARDLHLLTHLGWGQSRAGSQMFQLHRAATQALQSLAGQSPADHIVSHEEALRIATATLADTPSVTERAAAPVQLLGYLESTGLTFTHLWVTGLNDAELPATPRANSLFDVQELVAAGVRRTNHADELAFAQSRLRQWSAATSSLVVSHATSTHSGLRRPSPMVADIDALPYASLFDGVSPTPRSHAFSLNNEPQATLDELANPWQPIQLNGGRLPGGSGLLQAQLTCPFQAFARYRLGIDVAPPPNTFANALQVGNLIHSALENLFNRFQNSDALTIVSEQDVAAVVASTLEGLATHWPWSVAQQFSAWIAARVLAWIGFDRSLGVVNVVALEKAHIVKLGDFEVKAVVDRLDESNESLIVIDYKTGQVPSSQQVFNTDEQMRQTQLPLYALINPAVKAVLYAKVHEPPRYSGLRSATTPELPGVNTTHGWDTLVTTWRQQLTELAVSFAKGPTEPTPASPRVCNSCAARGLCRFPVDQRV